MIKTIIEQKKYLKLFKTTTKLALKASFFVRRSRYPKTKQT